MNTHEITDILNQDPKTSKFPCYVVARDEFESLDVISFPSFYVCNLDESTKPGSHWVAIYFKSKKQCEYFDSYGLAPFFDSLLSKMLLYSRCITYNRLTIQGLNTAVCGQYCILFILFRSRSLTYNSFLQYFQNYSTEVSDHSVNYFINYFMSKLGDGNNFQTHSNDVSRYASRLYVIF